MSIKSSSCYKGEGWSFWKSLVDRIKNLKEWRVPSKCSKIYKTLKRRLWQNLKDKLLWKRNLRKFLTTSSGISYSKKSVLSKTECMKESNKN